ncbi:MAG: hypothetical protein M3Y87_10335, partial [Myxococcota bacterium]|nr:hypothetical protein [Myxococcota bacterium]
MDAAPLARVVIVGVGAVLGMLGIRHVRAIEAANRHRWGADESTRELPVGGAYRAARVTVMIERGVPRIAHAAATLGVLLAVCDVVVPALATVALLEHLATRADQTMLAISLLAPLVVAGVVLARSALVDAARLVRCDPTSLDVASSVDWALVHLGVHAIVAIVGAADALLAAIALAAIALGAAQLWL